MHNCNNVIRIGWQKFWIVDSCRWIVNGKLCLMECFRMTLPYEQLSEDLRRTERLKRQRAREAWKRETVLPKYLYNLGTMTA